MTRDEAITLITREDVTPNLNLILRREAAGRPVDGLRVADLKQTLRELRSDIDRAEIRLGMRHRS